MSINTWMLHSTTAHWLYSQRISCCLYQLFVESCAGGNRTVSQVKIYFKNLLALIVPCLNWFYLRKHFAKFQVLFRPPVPRVLVVIKWQCNFERCS